jgi:proton-translocating NADH-quinone oxidoreductase chain N
MEFIFDIDWIAGSTEIFLLLVINILVIYSVVYTTSPSYNYPILLKNITWLSILVLTLALTLNLANPLTGSLIFNNLIIVDSFGNIIKGIVLLATVCILLAILNYNKLENLNSVEYLLLMVLACIGMILLISSYDLIVVYLAVEFQSFCLYIMASLKRNSEFSTEGGLKYFILGAFSSGLLLFGCSLVYGFTGTTNFQQLFQIFSVFSGASSFLQYENAILAGVTFILIGLLFKLSAFPFHIWAPDVYEGAPTSITAFFAIVPKISILALLVRFLCYVSYGFFLPWQQILVMSSFGSMLIGTFGALFQKKIKRLLAYSGIGHVGYMLIGLSSGSVDGISSTFFYASVYMIMTAGTFIILLSLRGFRNFYKLKFLNDLSGLAYSNPLLAITFSIILFSMSGVPPLAGFFSKMFIFISAINAGMYPLAICGVLTSVVASFYYIRVIKIMCFELQNFCFLTYDIGREKSLLLGSTFFFLLTFFFWPSSLMLSLHNAVFFFCV